MNCQKALFSIEPGTHYINGAYMSPSMNSVEAAGIQGVMRKSRPWQVTPQDFFTESEKLRSLFAQIVNAASAQQVAFIPSVSYGMAIVAKNLPVKKGQKIIVAAAQFPSNVYPWMTLAREKGVEVQTINMPDAPENRAQRWNELILDAIDNRTALVALGHIHWANGTIFDLKAMSQKVHAGGGLIAVDGTQSVGALPVDVQDFELDALVCGGYKWLMGPYSLGYAWLNEVFHQGSPLEENWINRFNSEDFTQLTEYQSAYQPGALRYDVGEHSNFALVPMGIAALEQLLAWGPGNIQQYCRNLTANAVKIWQEYGFGVENEAFRAAHLFGIELPKHISPDHLQQVLKEHHISVSVRGKFVRIAPNVYNDAADIAALTKVLTSVSSSPKAG